MKLRLDNNGSRIVLNKNQTFRTDSGWDESFQTYERELLEEIVNPIENYETCRYIHKPYISSNGIEQSNIWFYFYFVKNGSYSLGLDYYSVGIEQNDSRLINLKNSFFKLEFYKVPEGEEPNRSNRRLVFSKNLNPMVGERITIPSGQKLYVPVFTGSPLKNKENMYLFWFEDDTVLEETILMGGTFYMTAKFYNSVDGSKIQFANKQIAISSEFVEEDDMYFRVFMDRSNAPTYHYVINEYSTLGIGDLKGTTDDPIKFYEIGGNSTPGVNNPIINAPDE